mgnify:FL=1
MEVVLVELVVIPLLLVQQELLLVHLVLQQLVVVEEVDKVLEEMVVQVVVVAEVDVHHTEEEQEIHLQLLPLKEEMVVVVLEMVMVVEVV